MKDFNEFQSNTHLNEDINQFVLKFKKYYREGKVMSFKNWLKVMEELLDELQ
jgi:hypothetical protein